MGVVELCDFAVVNFFIGFGESFGVISDLRSSVFVSVLYS